MAGLQSTRVGGTGHIGQAGKSAHKFGPLRRTGETVGHGLLEFLRTFVLGSLSPCPMQACKEVLNWGSFRCYELLTVWGALLSKELMVAGGRCTIRPGICDPGADLPFNTLDHQQCVS